MTKVMELAALELQQLGDARRAGIRTIRTPIVNVDGWGAKGDDTTDDSLAIAAAIAAAEAMGGTEVYFSAKRYVVKSPILYTSDLTFVGAGGRATRIRGVGVSKVFAPRVTDARYFRTSFRDLWIAGDADTTDRVVDLTNACNFEMTNCEITGAKAAGGALVWLENRGPTVADSGCYYNSFRDCLLSNAQYGFVLTSPGYGVNANLFSGGKVSLCERAFDLRTAAIQNVITAVAMEVNTAYNVYLGDSTAVTDNAVMNCYMEGTAVGVYLAARCSGNIVFGGHFFSASGATWVQDDGRNNYIRTGNPSGQNIPINLLRNAGFEQGALGAWTGHPSIGAGGMAVAPVSLPHSSYALKLPGTGVNANRAVRQTFAVRETETYTVSGDMWVNTSAVANRPEIRISTGDGTATVQKAVIGIDQAYLTPRRTYQKVTIPVGHNQLIIDCYGNEGNAAGQEMYWDSLCLQPGDVPVGRPGRFIFPDSPPLNPVDGDAYRDLATGNIKVYNKATAAWKTITVT